VSDQEQLQWEARWRRPFAAAAFAAGFVMLAGTGVLLSVPLGREDLEPRPDFLLGVDDSPVSLIGATALQAIAALCLSAAFYYLFRATIHRGPQIPKWFVYLIVAGPIMYAVAQVFNAIAQIDAAEIFADGRPIAGNAGDDRAEDVLQDNVSPIGLGLGFAGSVSIAFLFVMLPLRARRVGLLSPFMGILGVIAGVLFVLPLLPGVPVVLQAFWLGALGSLFLGNWPGGRGPAWETGEPDPWPAPARRRQAAAADADADAGAADAPGASNGAAADRAASSTAAEPEPTPQRPSSRKRRRKRG